MADYIEGRRAVEEALRAGVPIRRVLVQKTASGDRASSSSLDSLVDRIRKTNPQAVIESASKGELDEISARGMSHGAHQGIVAEVPPYRYADLADIVRRAASKDNALVVLLDHVTDEGNFGAIIRTAEVVGADGVVIPSKRAAQVSVGVYKTSAGAALHLPVARVPNLSAAMASLKEAGFWVAGASEKASSDVWHAPLYGRIALVMGSEGEGISQLVQRNCDFLVSLPQAGRVGSLNVAQATCAICYEWMRQCTARGEGGR